LAMRSRTSVSPVWGSTSLSLQVSSSEAMIAQRRPPPSDPANRRFLRPSATGRMARSTGLVSSSIWPSSRKRESYPIERVRSGSFRRACREPTASAVPSPARFARRRREDGNIGVGVRGLRPAVGPELLVLRRRSRQCGERLRARWVSRRSRRFRRTCGVCGPSRRRRRSAPSMVSRSNPP